MKREYDVTVEEGEDGYRIGRVPSLPGCHTQSKTLEELLERMEEAIELVVEDLDDGEPVNDPMFVGAYRVAV